MTVPRLSILKLLIALLVILPLAVLSSAEAAKKKAATPPPPPKAIYEAPMTVAVVRSSEAGCEPLCPEWISAEGEITAATPALFRQVFKVLGKRRLPVLIRSPGGSINHALVIGRMIRKRQLDVAVGWTFYRGCTADAKACALPKEQKGSYRGVAYDALGFCNSACSLVLASGTTRLASSGSSVGVHQARTKFVQERLLYREYYRIVNGKKKIISRKLVSRKPGKSYEKFGMYKGLRNDLTAYLKDMGVSLALFDDMDRAPPTDIYQLTPKRMMELKLITSFNTVQTLTTPKNCVGTMAIASCLLIEPPKTKAVPVLAGVGGEGAAVKEAPMTFIVARGYAGPCEPLCPQWIAAEGEITPESVKALKATLRQLAGKKLPVIINSPGGDFDAALAMGGMIHDARLDIVVARTGYRDCQPAKRSCALPNGAASPGFIVNLGKCQGSCMFVLAGGKKRYVAQGNAIFTIRRPYDNGAKAAIPASSVRLHGYFESLGIDNSLLKFMNELRKGDERALPPGFSQQVGLVSAEIDPMALVGHNACFPTEPASYCVKLQ